MSKKYIVIALATIGLSMTARAEWETSIHAGADIASGNSETAAYAGGIESKNTNDVSQLLWNIKGAYGEAEINGVKDTTTEKAEAGATYRKVVSDPFYVYLNGSLLYDSIANINYRGIIGPGFGTFLINDGPAQLGVELGAAYIFDDLESVVNSFDTEGNRVRSSTDISDENVALRVAQFYTRKLNANAHVWQSLEWLPLFEDFGNYLLNAEIGIESVVSGDLSLRLVATERYDAEPAAGTDESDFTLTAGLSYQL